MATMLRLHRSLFVGILALGTLLFGDSYCGVAAEPQKPSDQPGRLWVYFGTYTNTRPKSQGIYLGQFDLAVGKLESVVPAGKAVNPSFLVVHPSRPLLFAVSEVPNFDDKHTGAVYAFSIQPKTGQLTLLDQQSSGGGGPCHVTIDRSGQYVLVANYGTGSIASLPIQKDGQLGPAISVIQHVGSSINRQRQKGPHAHSLYLDPANRIALACDLGVDKIMIYSFDAGRGKLTASQPAFLATRPGAGPRHLAFHPNGRWLYGINELDNTVTAYRYDAAAGTLEAVESLSTLPEGFRGTNTAAEIAAGPSGKFLYASNRGHNSIAIFAIDGSTGKLHLVGHEPSQGKTPRSFAIDPGGRYLLVVNQDSNNVVVFRIDAASGRLQAVGEPVEVPSPVCVELTRPVE
jgi:6-phosphogluconolactonase